MTVAERPSSAAIDLAHEADFAIGALQVRPATREAALGDRRESLEPRVMQALVALARAKGQVVSRDDLIAAAWEGRVVGDDAINRAIAGVRRVGQDFGAFSVETVARVGYRLNETNVAGSARKRRPPAWAWIAGAAVVVLAVGAGLWL